MKRFATKKVALIAAATLALAAVGAPQLKQLIKAGGALVVVNTFGKDINKGINKLWDREDTPRLKTKVVPILTVGVGTPSAVGAAQVMGPPDAVDRVAAVASPEVKFLGELRLRALIPVSTKNPDKSSLKAVENVGVSGIVDIKL
ncbi:MAG: hypothetical protein HZC36_15215 [Armatimonadetes bacterium]|nr:hypothetical protein [Armatimonadota bacterium]